MDRLFMADDWVRREILLAKNQQATIVPVLVDREYLPSTAALPKELQFLTGLQALKIRQANPEDIDGLADKIAALVPPGCHRTTVHAGRGVAIHTARSRLGESNPRPTHYERVECEMVVDGQSGPVLDPASESTASEG